MPRRAAVLYLTLLLGAACSKSQVAPETLKQVPLDGTESVLTKAGVGFDAAASSDGNGSLRIDVGEPTTIRLFEFHDLDVENCRLIYRSRLRAENVEGKAFLEMWCVFPGMGEYFSRSLQSPLSGTVDWTTSETPFFLQKGQKPELVKLNVVVDGTGTVWVDDITLSKGPLM